MTVKSFLLNGLKIRGYFDLTKLLTCIEALSSYKPVPGFQGTVGQTAVTKMEKKDMDLVTILPTHIVLYIIFAILKF